MRKFLLPLILIFSLISFPTLLNSAIIVPPTEPVTQSINIKSLKVKDMENILGRKMTVKEKVKFFIAKKIGFAETGSSGQTAMIFGIAGAALFIIGLFVPYVLIGAIAAGITAVVLGSVAHKRNPEDRKAYAGKLLGWITIGGIVILSILALILLATWFG
jgi:hypothetical protein